MNRSSDTPPRLAIVVPCYNEQEILADTNTRLTELLAGMIARGRVAADSYIMYGDDGSSDSTWNIIADMAGNNALVEGVRLAGNVGHQNMLLALLEVASDHSDAVVSIDADLQDDIMAIPEMVDRYAEGYDIVLGVRNRRDSDTWFKRTSALAFYKLLSALGVHSVPNHADFRLMSRRAVKTLLQYNERNLYLRGIVCSMGFRQTSVFYDRHPRLAGESKYPLAKMMNLAIEGITSFSIRPVRFIFTLGLIFLLVALGILVYVLVKYFQGDTVAGWSSLILSIWFCSGVVLMSLGIMGEYIGKIYTEVKQRPRYTVTRNTIEE